MSISLVSCALPEDCRGQVWTTKDKVYHPIYTLVHNHTLESLQSNDSVDLLAESVNLDYQLKQLDKRSASDTKSRPCVVMDQEFPRPYGHPTIVKRWRPKVCVMTTLGGSTPEDLPATIDPLLQPLFHLMKNVSPTWYNDNSWIILVPYVVRSDLRSTWSQLPPKQRVDPSDVPEFVVPEKDMRTIHKLCRLRAAKIHRAFADDPDRVHAAVEKFSNFGRATTSSFCTALSLNDDVLSHSEDEEEDRSPPPPEFDNHDHFPALPPSPATPLPISLSAKPSPSSSPKFGSPSKTKGKRKAKATVSSALGVFNPDDTIAKKDEDGSEFASAQPGPSAQDWVTSSDHPALSEGSDSPEMSNAPSTPSVLFEESSTPVLLTPNPESESLLWRIEELPEVPLQPPISPGNRRNFKRDEIDIPSEPTISKKEARKAGKKDKITKGASKMGRLASGWKRMTSLGSSTETS